MIARRTAPARPVRDPFDLGWLSAWPWPLEAPAFGVAPLGDILELTRPVSTWLLALGLGVVPLVAPPAWRIGRNQLPPTSDQPTR